jgi:hypothetical protein
VARPILGGFHSILSYLQGSLDNVQAMMLGAAVVVAAAAAAAVAESVVAESVVAVAEAVVVVVAAADVDVVDSNYQLDNNRPDLALFLEDRLESELGFLAHPRKTPKLLIGCHCRQRGTAHCQTCDRKCRPRLRYKNY